MTSPLSHHPVVPVVKVLKPRTHKQIDESELHDVRTRLNGTSHCCHAEQSEKSL